MTTVVLPVPAPVEAASDADVVHLVCECSDEVALCGIEVPHGDGWQLRADQGPDELCGFCARADELPCVYCGQVPQ
jgi:hypothetical protein